MSKEFLSNNLPFWYKEALTNLTPKLAWKNHSSLRTNEGSAPSTWAKNVKKDLEQVIPLFGHPYKLDPSLLTSEETENYTLETLEFSPHPYQRLTIKICIPHGAGPFPGALVLHDHGGVFEIGTHKVMCPLALDPFQDLAQRDVERNYGGRYLVDWLTQKGYMCAVLDAPGWGSRYAGGYENQQALASNLANLGLSWAGLIAREDDAAAQVLQADPRCMANSVLAIGHSMGGFRAAQLAALSDAVSGAIASAWLGTLEGMMYENSNRTRGQSAWATTHTGIFALLDFPDFFGLAVPKPLVCINGVQDSLFPEKQAREAGANIQTIYTDHGAKDNFACLWHQGGHFFGKSEQDLALSVYQKLSVSKT